MLPCSSAVLKSSVLLCSMQCCSGFSSAVMISPVLLWILQWSSDFIPTTATDSPLLLSIVKYCTVLDSSLLLWISLAALDSPLLLLIRLLRLILHYSSGFSSAALESWFLNTFALFHQLCLLYFLLYSSVTCQCKKLVNVNVTKVWLSMSYMCHCERHTHVTLNVTHVSLWMSHMCHCVCHPSVTVAHD